MLIVRATTFICSLLFTSRRRLKQTERYRLASKMLKKEDMYAKVKIYQFLLIIVIKCNTISRN